jgi:hypothetical protein
MPPVASNNSSASRKTKGASLSVNNCEFHIVPDLTEESGIRLRPLNSSTTI